MEQNLKKENHHITYFHVLNDLNFDKIKEIKTNSKNIFSCVLKATN